MSSRLILAWNKIVSLTHRNRREREMDEEMRFHIELEAAELRRSGISALEAERRARAAFGGLERQKDDARDAVGVRMLDDLSQDFRYALRQLRASVGYAAAALMTLVLGVGAATRSTPFSRR